MLLSHCRAQGTGERFRGACKSLQQRRWSMAKAYSSRRKNFLNYTSFFVLLQHRKSSVFVTKVLYFYVSMALFKARFLCFQRKAGVKAFNFFCLVEHNFLLLRKYLGIELIKIFFNKWLKSDCKFSILCPHPCHSHHE